MQRQPGGMATDRKLEPTFLIGEVGVDLMKSLQQTLLFHKREKGHSLPGVFLSVQINLEVCRVEVNDGGVLCE